MATATATSTAVPIYATFIAKNTNNSVSNCKGVTELFEDVSFVKNANVSEYSRDAYNDPGADYGGTTYSNYSFLIIGELCPKFADLYAVISGGTSVPFSIHGHKFMLSKLQ
jgi:hypothetical protein